MDVTQKFNAGNDGLTEIHAGEAHKNADILNGM